MHVRELIARIERVADPRLAASWDKSGVQIAGTATECTRLAVTLDPLPHLVAQALDWGATCILTHHPLTLSPRLPDRLDDYHRVLALVLGHGAWLYAAHTSLDVRTDGPAGWLADALDMQNRRVLEPAGLLPHVQTRLRLPAPGDRGRVMALVRGRDRCQVLALTDRDLELVHPEAAWPDLQAALTAICPGIAVVSALTLASPADVYGYGLVGDLPAPLPFARLGERLVELVPHVFFRLAGEEPETVTRLAYCPGSGADMASLAFAAGATVHITGDLKYHQAQAVPPGHCILDVGHFSLEEVMLRHFARDLAAQWGDAGPAIRYFPGTDPIAPLFPDGTTSRRTE